MDSRYRISSSRHRSRTAVCAGFVSFVLTTLGLDIQLDRGYSRYRDPEFAWHARWAEERRSQNPQREMGIVLGTSRSQLGFNPSELGMPEVDSTPLVANFAQTGCVPIYALMNLKRVLAEGFRPAFVLFEIMPPILPAEAPAEVSIAPRRMSHTDAVAMREYCGSPDAWVESRVAPWFSYRTEILNHLAPRTLPWSSNTAFLWANAERTGWLPCSLGEVSPSERASRTAGVREQYRPVIEAFAIAPCNDRAIREAIGLCRERGIPIAGFLMPESPEFRSWYRPGAQKVLSGYLARLRIETGFRCFDCSDWLPERDFYDGHHLLQGGSSRFSRRFGAECLRPWLEELQGVAVPP